ncbi:MAG: hypothetical protein L0G82_10950 [Pseudomonas sp.]|uniref:hypothetical protein n=1 Tax=Ectopseudomonas composti TaxID=658457 RepID=UPI0005647812|nr:hypothetical protein [Pseudomonas composti]MDN5515742.1 hypothetical protein [Pseudomonas sp.]
MLIQLPDSTFVWRQILNLAGQKKAALAYLRILQGGEKRRQPIQRPIQLLYITTTGEARLASPYRSDQQHQAQIKQRNQREQLAFDTTD